MSLYEILEAKAGNMNESLSLDSRTGEWSVEEREDAVMLVWTCLTENCPDDIDISYQKQGGDDIIASAGRDFDDSGTDAYTDQYGDDMVAHWVLWNII